MRIQKARVVGSLQVEDCTVCTARLLLGKCLSTTRPHEVPWPMGPGVDRVVRVCDIHFTPHVCNRCPSSPAVSALNYDVLAVTPRPTFHKNMVASVTIGGVDGGVPALNFLSFSVDQGYATVRLFDGSSTSAPLLGVYSGTWREHHLKVGTSGAKPCSHNAGVRCTQHSYVSKFECARETS